MRVYRPQVNPDSHCELVADTTKGPFPAVTGNGPFASEQTFQAQELRSSAPAT